MSQNNQTNFDN